MEKNIKKNIKEDFKQEMMIAKSAWNSTGARYYVKLISLDLAKKGIKKTDNRIRNSINYGIVDYDVLNSLKNITAGLIQCS